MERWSPFRVVSIDRQECKITLENDAETFESSYQPSEFNGFDYQTLSFLIAELENGEFVVESRHFKPEDEKIYNEYQLKLEQVLAEKYIPSDEYPSEEVFRRSYDQRKKAIQEDMERFSETNKR